MSEAYTKHYTSYEQKIRELEAECDRYREVLIAIAAAPPETTFPNWYGAVARAALHPEEPKRLHADSSLPPMVEADDIAYPEEPKDA